jgi:hypothetical protein
VYKIHADTRISSQISLITVYSSFVICRHADWTYFSTWLKNATYAAEIRDSVQILDISSCSEVQKGECAYPSVFLSFCLSLLRIICLPLHSVPVHVCISFGMCVRVRSLHAQMSMCVLEWNLIYSRFVSPFFSSEDHSLVFVGEDKQKPDLQLNGAENSIKKSKSFISLKHSRWSRSSGKLPDPLSSGAESSPKPINLEDTEWNNALRCLFVFCYVCSEYSCVCVIDR